MVYRASLTGLARVNFASYRDPNLQATIDTYRNAAAYLENYDAQEREVTKTIIGTISGMDTPLTPNMKGRRSITAYLTEQSIEELQKTRDQVPCLLDRRYSKTCYCNQGCHRKRKCMCYWK